MRNFKPDAAHVLFVFSFLFSLTIFSEITTLDPLSVVVGVKLYQFCPVVIFSLKKEIITITINNNMGENKMKCQTSGKSNEHGETKCAWQL